MRLLCLTLCAASLPDAGAATHVPIPTAVTGETLDGELVGSSPFTLAGSVDPVSGRLLIRAALSHGQAPQALVEFSQPGPALAVVAAAGDAALPGLAFTSFLAPQACAGQTTFWAGLNPDPAAQTIQQSGVFLRAAGQILAVAVTGTPAPGGGTYVALGSSPQVDRDGRMIFLATTSLGGDELILLQRSSGGTLSHLLLVGDTDSSGDTVLAILDADMSCGGLPLALVNLDTAEGPRRALLAAGLSGWDSLLRQGDLMPDQTEIASILLPAAVTTDGAVHVVVDRGAGAGPALARIDSAGNGSLLARADDATSVGSSITGFGPPVPLDGQRVAWRSTLADGTGLPAAAEHHALMAAGPDDPVYVVLAPGAISPGAGILLDLGDPAGGGDGALHLAARAEGEPTRDGLLHWTGAVAWAAPAGSPLPGWGRFLGGGFRTGQPAVDDTGRTAFLASLPAGSQEDALFIATQGQPPSRLLGPADALLGGGMVTRLSGPPALAPAGVVWVAAEVDEPPARLGYVRAVAGSLPVLALAEGDPAPPGGTFRTLGRILSADSSGRLLFTATLSGSSSASGVFFLAGGIPSPAALAGGPAPGGGTFSAFGFSPAATGSGTAFLAYTGGTRTGSGIFHADLSGPAPVPAALALSGDSAPGGGAYLSFQDPVAGEDGSVAFIALLDSGSTVLFVNDAAGTRRLLGAGDALPDGATATGILDVAVAASGIVYASIQVTGASAPARVVALNDGATVTVMESGALVPLSNGQEARLQSFPSLGAGGSDHLVMAVELEGWSTGAAVVQAGQDADADGRADLLDCAPLDNQAWSLPPVVNEIQVLIPTGGGSTTPLSWDTPALAAGPGTTHEVLAGTVQSLHTSGGLSGATCATAGVTGESTQVPDGVPGPGEAFWYLVRGRNGCGVGELAAATAVRDAPASLCAAP